MYIKMTLIQLRRKCPTQLYVIYHRMGSDGVNGSDIQIKGKKAGISRSRIVF